MKDAYDYTVGTSINLSRGNGWSVSGTIVRVTDKAIQVEADTAEFRSKKMTAWFPKALLRVQTTLTSGAFRAVHVLIPRGVELNGWTGRFWRECEEHCMTGPQIVYGKEATHVTE